MEEVLEVRQSRRWSVGTLGNKSFFLRGITETLTAKEEEKKGKGENSSKAKVELRYLSDGRHFENCCAVSTQRADIHQTFLFFSFLISPVGKGENEPGRSEKE